MRAVPRRAPAGVVAAAVALALAGCAAVGPGPASPGGGAPTPPGGAAAPVPDAVRPGPAVPVHRATLPPVQEVAAPARLVVPGVGIDMAVRPTGLAADGSMELLPSGQEAAWYEYGPAPATGAGSTVLASHVDTRLDGIGQLARLTDVRRGDPVTVTDTHGTASSYTVRTVEQVAKSGVPLGRVFDRSGPPRLVIVTCGGEWDAATGHYEDNLVVTAVPAGPRG